MAHSGERAEKSGAVREEYNARRAAGTRALDRLGLPSFREASESDAGKLIDRDEHDTFQHVTSEARRVREAVDAMERDDPARFGALLLESHASLRERLRVSTPALDRLVEAAMKAGACGARLTGAGFGGCAVILSRDADRLCAALAPHYDLIPANPGPGVLSC